MACFHPFEAWQLESGKIVFRETRHCRRALWLPCGKCIGCRSVRARSWAVRCIHEASLHEVNSFVTLTYDDEHCPLGLDYSHYQRFMRNLRRHCGAVRFFAVGEYGEITFRPHFHALLFGFRPADGVKCGSELYSSKLLSKLWPHGFSSFGNVTYESAGYVARYCQKKVTGDIAKVWYTRVDPSTGELAMVRPEFGRMSLRPHGLGYGWFVKYYKEVYEARDGVVRPGGFVIPPPRYYDKLLFDTDPGLMCEKEYDRYIRSQRFVDDCTPERLLVRERCAKARLAFKKRKL